MKTLFATVVSSFLLLASGLASAQSSSVFLDRSGPTTTAEPTISFPSGFFDGLEVAAGDTTLGTRILNAMHATFLKTRSIGRHGVGASVIIPGLPQWSGSIGNSDAITPLDTNMLFEIASNTKTFVTALIMELRDEDKLSLADPIRKWLPIYANIDSNITIQQLLSHSSGMYDYLNDDPQQRVITAAYFTLPAQRWSPDEILSGYVGAANFKAGTSYRYCNTGFLMLGMIAEKAGGDKLSKQLHARFIEPLKLSHTFVGGDDTITIPFAHNWYGYDTTVAQTDFYPIEKTAQLTCSFGAGNVVSTVGDLARWGHMLYTGQVVSKASLTQMTTVHLWPDNEYGGLGTFRVPYYSRSLFGHTGHLPGFLSYNFTNQKDSASFVLYQNSEPLLGDPSINDYALDILGEIYRATGSVASATVPAHISAMSYPNPAHNHVTIAYSISKPSAVQLRVFDETGRELRSSARESRSAGGIHRYNLDLTGFRAGSYLYTLQSSAGVSTGKFVVE